MIEALRGSVSFFTLAPPYQADKPSWTLDEWAAQLKTLLTVLGQGSPEHPLPLLLCLHPDDDQQFLTALIEQSLQLGVQSIVIDDGLWDAEAERRRIGSRSNSHALALVQYIRTTWGEAVVIIANGGIHQPAEALTKPRH